MSRLVVRCAGMGFFLLCCTVGCTNSSSAPSGSRPGGSPSASESTGKAGTAGQPLPAGTSGTDEVVVRDGKQYWKEFPDVPYVPIMTEVDGISIPRIKQKQVEMQLAGKVPADVGNEYAKAHPGEPTTGDWVIIRFNAEPQSLNPVTETSAYQQYISSYVNEGLLRQNPETFEFEPHIAHRWVVEDTLKLSPDTPGSVRRLALGTSPAAGETEITVKNKEEKLEFKTTDGDGKPMGDAWVGLFAIGSIPGAPVTGYHNWSDSQGNLSLSGILPGKYRAVTGVEVYGHCVKKEDGAIEFTASSTAPSTAGASAENESKPRTFAKGEWVDLQAQTVWTYHLRDDVKWSDGTPYTSADVVFAYDVINNPIVDGDSIRVYYQDLVKCEATDAHTVRMKYRQQYFKAIEFTASITVYGAAKHALAKEFAEEGLTLTDEPLTEEQETAQKKVSVHGKKFGQAFNKSKSCNESPLGTGPYIIDKWERSDRVEVRRNPIYWRPELAGHLDKLIFRFIPDNVTALQALKAGEIDFFYRTTAEQYFEQLELPSEREWVQKDYVKSAWYSPGFRYVGWNLLRPIFQDRRVRIALSLLFDREDFLEKKMHKAGVTVACSSYYFGKMYDHQIKPLGYDPDVAKELLSEAGWIDSDNDGILDKDGKPFEFQFLYPPGNQLYEAQAAIMQKSLKQAGIKMDVRTYEWASFIDKIKNKDFDAVTLAWASPIEQDPYQIWHSSGAGLEARGSNHVSFNDPLADELIDTMRVTLDQKKRKLEEWSFDRILDREQPYMFLWTPQDFGVYHHRFQGVKWYKIRPGFDLSEWYVPKDQQLRGKG